MDILKIFSIRKMAKVTTVFMWIFTIILLAGLILQSLLSIGMSCGWFDDGNKFSGIANKIKFTTESNSHKVIDKRVTLGIAGGSIGCIIILMIIIGASDKKESFKSIYF